MFSCYSTGTTKHAEFRPWTPQLSTTANSNVISALNTTAKIRERITEDFATFEDEVRLAAAHVAIGDPSDAATTDDPASTTVSYVDPRSKYFSLVTDVRTKCPLVRLAQTASAHFSSDVFFYEVVATRSQASSNDTVELFAAADAYSDVDAIFGVYDSQRPSLFANSFQSAFFDFVRTGKLPSSSGSSTVRDGKVHEFVADGKSPMRVLDLGATYAHCDIFLNSSLYPNYARMD
jgi:hypothetical protein